MTRPLSSTERAALGWWLRSFLPYQRRWIADPSTITLCVKARQAGYSHATAGGAVYQALITGSTEVILSASQDLSDEVLDKAGKHARVLSRLGFASAAATETDNAKVLSWPHGGRVIALPANPRTARSYTGNVWFDEFAYHLDPKAMWDAAAAVAIRGNRRIRLISTPNGAGGLFFDWATHPPRGWGIHRTSIHDAIREGLQVDINKLWQLAGGNKSVFAQWFELSFLHAGTPFFDEAALDLAETELRDPIALADLPRPLADFSRTIPGLRAWQRPSAGVEYVIGGDPSGGGGGDWAAATVRAKTTLDHVATLRTQLKPDPFGAALVSLAQIYNGAEIVPERNNHGAATIAAIERAGHSIWHAPDGKAGFLTNEATRPVLLSAYERAIREGAASTHDRELAAERRAFVIHEDGKPRAQRGCHDDIVLADALTVRVASSPVVRTRPRILNSPRPGLF